MKFIVILGPEHLQDKLFNVLKEVRVKVYSKFDIMGHAVKSDEDLLKWYDSKKDADYSVSFFAFVKEAETAKRLMEEVRMLNKSSGVDRPFHAYQMDVESFA